MIYFDDSIHGALEKVAKHEGKRKGRRDLRPSTVAALGAGAGVALPQLIAAGLRRRPPKVGKGIANMLTRDLDIHAGGLVGSALGGVAGGVGGYRYATRGKKKPHRKTASVEFYMDDNIQEALEKIAAGKALPWLVRETPNLRRFGRKFVGVEKSPAVEASRNRYLERLAKKKRLSQAENVETWGQNLTKRTTHYTPPAGSETLSRTSGLR